jgi:hypothetical protein
MPSAYQERIQLKRPDTTPSPAQRQSIRRPASLRVQARAVPGGAIFPSVKLFNAAACRTVSFSSNRTPSVALKNCAVPPANFTL